MGADIHQFNIIRFRDGSILRDGVEYVDHIEKNADGFEYEVQEEVYKSDYVPELIPGRDSDMFAFMAGSRGDAPFKIYPEPGIPEWLDQPAQADIKEYLTKDRYGHCYYTAIDLLEKLKKAEARIEWYMRVKAAKNPEYIKYGEIDEDDIMLEKVRKMKEKLNRQITEGRDHPINWTDTCICFNFDC